MAFTEAITGGKAHIVEVAWFCFSRQDATRFFNWHTMLKYFHEENFNACYPRKGWYGLFVIRTALVLILRYPGKCSYWHFAILDSGHRWYWLLAIPYSAATDCLLFRTALLLTPRYPVQCCYWLLAIPYSAATDFSIFWTALLLTPRYPVQRCYWLLPIPDSAVTDSSLSRTALLLTPPYSGQRCFWLIAIPYTRTAHIEFENTSSCLNFSRFNSWTLAPSLNQRYPGQ